MRGLLWIALFLVFAAGVSQAQPSFTNVKLDDAFVFPGKLILAQVIEIKTSESLTIEEIVLKNTATASDPKIEKIGAGDLEYIEIRRGSRTGQVLKKETLQTGADLKTGVTIGGLTNNSFSAGTHRLYILVKLKADESLIEKKLALGETKVNVTSVSYGAGKTYTVRLTVTDEGGEAVTKEVDFSWTPEEPKVGQPVKFVPDVPDTISPKTFAWDFGDGSGSTEREPTHRYKEPGEFKVGLIVIDAQDNQWEAPKKTITISAATGPTVTSLTASPPVPEVGQEVTFTATVRTPEYDPVTGWEWDFGDGTVDSTSASPAKHTYTKSGAYTVKVRVSTRYGGQSPWKTLELYVRPKGGAMLGTEVLDNPASNQCRIRIFAPANARDLKITILDQAGRPVLLDKPVSIGTFTWDLKDRDGRMVPNGLYLFYVTGKIGDKVERSEIGRILVRR